jgi:hypothetical protein
VPTLRTSLSDSLVSFQTARALAGHLAAIDQALDRSSTNSDSDSSNAPLDDEFSIASEGADDDVIDSAWDELTAELYSPT